MTTSSLFDVEKYFSLQNSTTFGMDTKFGLGVKIFEFLKMTPGDPIWWVWCRKILFTAKIRLSYEYLISNMQLRLTFKKSNWFNGLGSIAAITAPDGPAELAQYVILQKIWVCSIRILMMQTLTYTWFHFGKKSTIFSFKKEKNICRPIACFINKY